ncbi:uncharacterized protein PAE49_013363 [Odontesthes bonariensis]|uniref:uncharacterized protein LOC142396383 isoform X1 n=1 Tax=Odontesthes bonariensis TaxID=219752 RepID=UPI003F589097
MYLENSEQREGELSAEVLLAEQFTVPMLTEAAGLNSPSKGRADLGIKVLVEYTEQTVSTEMDPPLLCVERGNSNLDLTESCTFCIRHAESFEQQSTSNGFFESDRILDDHEAAGLSRQFDKCAQHCECFKPCKSSEHRANHSLASESSLCCEHCPEQLQLFQQCKSADEQSESSDFEPDELEVDYDSLEQCGMSPFIPECTEHLEFQQYVPLDQQCDSSDSEQDMSTEHSEQRFPNNISDSVDSLDGAAELCEYDEAQTQTEYTDDDDVDEDDESYEAEQNETELSVEDDTPAAVDFDRDVPFASDFGETHLCTEENSQTSTTDAVTDVREFCGNEEDCEYDASELCHSEESVEFCAEEEDCSSECSSVESKSFKTCLDDSFPSDPFSDSSEESDKGAQEDSSDEQMQWESFEGDEEETQKESDINLSNEKKKKTPAVDVVIEQYFDLFDREDCYAHMFAQKQHYISCFDGGDIHDHLYLEEEAQKQNDKTVNELEGGNEDIDQQEADTCSEDAPADSDEEDLSQEDDCCDSENPLEACTVKSDSSSAGGDVEENESESFAFYPESSREAEDDEASVDSEACSFDGNDFNDRDEEPEVCLDSADEQSMLAPFAKEISVEGDAYEDKVSSAWSHESLGEADSLADETEMKDDCKENDKDEPELKHSHFLPCSEMEPYWALIDAEESGEFCEPGVEEYYACQIKSIQSSGKQAMNQFILEGRSNCHLIGEDAPSSSIEAESQDAEVCPKEGKSVRFGLSEVTELNLSPVEKMPHGQSAESEDECGLKEISEEIRPPADVIHSVVSKHANDATQSRDSEEEPSDEESLEDCECEYCVPKAVQVPAKPLLPEMKSQDEGKICVVIDLDETLVHSSFKPVNNADFIIPVEIEGTVHQVYVLKRPHVDEFLKRMGELFECVLFTASLSKYADPVSDLLDKWGAFQSRLFREACVFHKGNYVKDLSRLGRDLNKVIIIDNSPASYIFHPENAVPVVSWFDDASDTELLDLIPFFERLSEVDDIYDVLKKQGTSS